MTAVCYWFSGTGNSLFVARKITEVFPQMQRVPITKALVENPPRIHGDVVGFVFPVYAYGPPAIVKRFIARAAKGEVGFLFTAVTHGGGPAAALTMVERLLTENNLPLHSAFSIRMPSNYVVGSNPVTGEKAAAIFAQGEKETTRMCELLAQRAHVPVVSAATGGRLKSWAVHPLFMRGLKTADRKFFSRDSCTGCGICVKVCPMENITLTAEKRPRWHGSCEYCLGCIHACPERAIQTGMLTKKRRRYRHRDIPLKALLNRDH